MGDRGNIVIRESNTNTDDVWLYTHWAGSDIKEIATQALSRRQRWDDPTYLARIVFQQMIGSDKGETGYGIATRLTDNEHPILVLDVPNQEVYTVDESTLDGNRLPKTPDRLESWTFEAFIARK